MQCGTLCVKLVEEGVTHCAPWCGATRRNVVKEIGGKAVSLHGDVLAEDAVPWLLLDLR